MNTAENGRRHKTGMTRGKAVSPKETRVMRNMDSTPAADVHMTPGPESNAVSGSANTAVPPLAGIISVISTIKKTERLNTFKLVDVLEQIRNCRYARTIKKIRAATNKEVVNDIKTHALPQFLNGVYQESRKEENRKTFAGFKIWDFDLKDNLRADWDKLKSHAKKWPFCIAAFESPSGGLKILIRTEEQDDAVFRELSAPWAAFLKMNIDYQQAAMNTCLMSSDANIYISAKADRLEEIPCIKGFETLSKTMDTETAIGLFPKLFENFVYESGEGFWERRIRNGVEQWFPVPRNSISLDLQEHDGVNRRMAALALRKLEQTRQARRVYPSRSHTKAGFYRAGELLKNDDILVTSSPKSVNPEKGRFRHIAALFRTVFPVDEKTDGPENCRRFLCWLATAAKNYDAISASNGKEFFPTPFLALMGEAGAGKDLLFETIICPLLGGRDPAMMTQFMVEEPWLDTIVGHEVVLGSEIRGMSWHERKVFSATTKSVLSGKFLANGKNRQPYYSATAHYLIELVNIEEGGNCADSLPADTVDMNDKIVCVSLFNSAEVKKVFPSGKRAKWAKVLKEELPAFKYWLCGYGAAEETGLRRVFVIPEGWRDDRFGVKGWKAAAAKRAEAETGSGFEMKAHRIFLWFLKNRGKTNVDLLRDPDGKGGYSAQKLSEIIEDNLRADGFPTNTPLNPRQIGNAMAKLCDHYPTIYRKVAVGGKTNAYLYQFMLPDVHLENIDADYTQDNDKNGFPHPFALAKTEFV